MDFELYVKGKEKYGTDGGTFGSARRWWIAFVAVLAFTIGTGTDGLFDVQSC